MKQSSNISIQFDEIKATEAFGKLTRIQKKIFINRNSRMRIQNGVNVALNIGLNAWKSRTNGSFFHVSVVEELYKIKLLTENNK